MKESALEVDGYILIQNIRAVAANRAHAYPSIPDPTIFMRMSFTLS